MNGGVIVEPILAYVDDIAIFCRASRKSLLALNDILHEFSVFSGLQINLSKNHIIFSKRVQDGGMLANILGFQLTCLPIQYLGAPITGKSISHRECTTHIADLQPLLDKWNQRTLSYMGWAQLVNWIFHGKFGYLVQSRFLRKKHNHNDPITCL